jgi:hypothetical protein
MKNETEPFTKAEGEIMSLIVEAHNKFSALERTHPMEITEWVDAIHRLQDLLGSRVLRRDYPKTFPTLTATKI